MFSHYTFFNNALKFEQYERYFDAIIEISKFLAYEPDDEVANKLYIFYLNKCGQKDVVKTKLSEFEEKFPRNSWIMEVESKGIDNLDSPSSTLKDISFETIKNPLLKLSEEFAKSKAQTSSELGTIAINFYSNLLRPSKSNVALYTRLAWFYDNVIIPQLAKREMRIESFDGKNYNDLTIEEAACVDVKTTIEAKNLPDGTIITDVPGVYIRSCLIQKQQIYVVKNKTNKEQIKQQAVAIHKKSKKKHGGGKK